VYKEMRDTYKKLQDRIGVILEKRINEAEKLGMEVVVVPHQALSALQGKYNLEFIPVRTVAEAIVKVYS